MLSQIVASAVRWVDNSSSFDRIARTLDVSQLKELPATVLPQGRILSEGRVYSFSSMPSGRSVTESYFFLRQGRAYELAQVATVSGGVDAPHYKHYFAPVLRAVDGTEGHLHEDAVFKAPHISPGAGINGSLLEGTSYSLGSLQKRAVVNRTAAAPFAGQHVTTAGPQGTKVEAEAFDVGYHYFQGMQGLEPTDAREGLQSFRVTDASQLPQGASVKEGDVVHALELRSATGTSKTTQVVKLKTAKEPPRLHELLTYLSVSLPKQGTTVPANAQQSSIILRRPAAAPNFRSV